MFKEQVHVGQYLIDYLVKEGAKVGVSDIFADKIKEVKHKFPKVDIVDPNGIYDEAMDIYAPCALGATINDDTLSKLKCAIIAGAANNQLANEAKHGQIVVDKGMIYAPDFLINAGGLINCYSELEGYNRDRAMSKTEEIYNTTMNILIRAEQNSMPTYQAANEMAEQRIEAIGNINKVL